MINRISTNNLIILKNFSYLTVMKFFNIGIKIILAAYLIRTLGSEKYGLITWLDSVIQYFIMIVNFGFNIYAAKYIVENKDKPFKINEIISSIFILKSLLFITSILSIIIIGNFDVFYDDRQLLTLLMLCGIGEVLFPIWFFQGVENLKPATIIVFISRIFLLIGTLIFVKNDQNVRHYVILFVSSSLLMGLLGFFYILRYFDLKIRLVSIRKLKGYFKESLPFFIGRFLSLAFNFGTIFFIGKFCLLEDVTGFDTSLKIVMLGVIPFEMLQQAVFPTISRTKNKKLLRNLVYFSMLVGTIIGTIIFLFSEHFMVWFGGIEMLQFSNALKILSILCPFVSLTFILGTCSLVAFGFHKEYNLSLIITSLIYVFILLALFFFNKITFWNLIYLRLFGDVLLVSMRLFYSLQKKTLITN
ncbi:oligosaccharide flippase family protein [uncultured Polaribacter sp.]|uniref:oligosaccharide flippase family protein n=1 Tax=uncultured Polaribacter sp. TaxID=174711 RepID=UPI00262673DE|nr:oligosaccharide flippase family protein [uncultured Polaribacter sp.]